MLTWGEEPFVVASAARAGDGVTSRALRAALEAVRRRPAASDRLPDTAGETLPSGGGAA